MSAVGAQAVKKARTKECEGFEASAAAFPAESLVFSTGSIEKVLVHASYTSFYSSALLSSMS